MLSARRIRKLFGTVPVLDDLSLEVAARECVALLGPNGAGKSTFLKIAATVLRPSSGTLTLLGHDVARSPERVRGAVGLVAHGAHVWEDLTAFENLRVWSTLGNRPADTPTLMRALAAVELEAAAHERARSFSAGMKRRLSLARYVDASVRLLLLDEPFTGLDQQGKKWLGSFLLDFKGAGGAVIMVTHDFGRSLEVADRIVILADGAVAVDRPRADLDRTELDTLYRVHTGETS
jgi:heme ABC exporter ATP-binding subunit CcmA